MGERWRLWLLLVLAIAVAALGMWRFAELGGDPSTVETPPAESPLPSPSTSPGAASTAIPAPGDEAAPAALAAPSPRRAASEPPIERGRFDQVYAHELAVRLADEVGPRPAGTDADAAARGLMAAELRDAGWTVTEEIFPLPQGGQSANLVATMAPGVRSVKHVVVGAHLDTVAGSPGANDNASGSAVVVALARELADEVAAAELPLVLVLFGAEEYQPSQPRVHHIGSGVYAEAHAEDVIAMLSVDMVGNGPATCICWFEAGPGSLASRLGSVGDLLLGGYQVERRGDISDHGPFARRGIPAAFLWSYTDGVLHTLQDTADRLQPDDIGRAGRLVLTWLRTMIVGGLENAVESG